MVVSSKGVLWLDARGITFFEISCMNYFGPTKALDMMSNEKAWV